MRYFDFHCDTLMRQYALQNAGPTDETLWHNKGQIDLERLIQNHAAAQCFAAYIWLVDKPVKEDLFHDALAMADLLYKALEEHPEAAAYAGDYDSYRKNMAEGKLSAFLTLEEGGILEGQLSRLDTLYQKGFRIITLTWNYENCIGYPNCAGYPEADDRFRSCGLKPFGLDVVERMEELGIIVDVSHLSDAGFEDVWNVSKRPFLATHSNARAITDHDRNLTDDMIRKLAERGGVTGLNFCGDFASPDHHSTADALAHQARYLINKGGSEFLCLGTDFDGIETDLEISDVSKIHLLVDAMERNGFTDEEIEAVCWKNAEKFIRNYWGSSE